MTIYRYISIFLSFSAIVNGFSQNLVVNPSFEDTLACPNEPSQVDKCVGWSAYTNTPDYYHISSKEYVGIPDNWRGKQEALWKNKAYMGLITYYQYPGYENRRETIGSKLLTQLIIGKKYYVSMKISFAEYSRYASNNIGMTFSTVPYSFIGQNKMIHKNHSIFYDSTIVKDNLSWIKLNGAFVADSNYRYIILGNFFTDSLTAFELINSQHSEIAYYYIDDICVSLDSFTCHNKVAIDDIDKNQNIKVYPNPFDGFLNIDSKDNSPLKVSIIRPSSEVMFQNHCESGPIDLRQLPAGIYFYIIQDINGYQFTGKIVKN